MTSRLLNSAAGSGAAVVAAVDDELGVALRVDDALVRVRMEVDTWLVLL